MSCDKKFETVDFLLDSLQCTIEAWISEMEKCKEAEKNFLS